MSMYFDFLRKEKNFASLLKSIKSNSKIEISGASRDVASLISLCLLDELDENIVVVCSNTFNAQKLYDSISQVSSNCLFYPKDDFLSIELLTESFDFKLERINAIKNVLFSDRKHIIVMPLTALLSKVPLKETYKSSSLSLKVGDVIKQKVLIKTLTRAGYIRNYTIEKQGEFSLRGSIVDIFPVNDDKAYRIDFFGDEIDSIKVFDIETQRSINSVKETFVLPKSEILFTDDEIETIKYYITGKLDGNLTEKTRERFETDLENLEDMGNFSVLEKYLSIFNIENYSFIDYIDNKTVIYYDYEAIRNQEVSIANQIYDYLSQYEGYFNNQQFLNKLSYYSFDKEIYVDNRRVFKTLDDNPYHTAEITEYKNRLDLLTAELKAKRNLKTICLSLNENSVEIVKNALETQDIDYVLCDTKIEKGKINIISDIPFMNVDLLDSSLLILNDSKIFKTFETKTNKYKLSVETKRLKSINELKVGDYVVHLDYGIGRFEEITTMTLRNHTNDYIHIKYDKNQSIYLPVENIHMLSKYCGSESFIPKLSSLNTNEWKKAKEQAQKKASDLAERLLSLYSAREKSVGFKYLPDDETQLEFENDFKYELTKDQAQAINDVKTDMMSDHPMDRLICGDVGFGKTEVALRAAFKAVLSGKQVAYLAPTTVLARQHYHSFNERMSKYGVNVSLVSRFVQPHVIKENLKSLERGTVDIIIGTHRLLSKDVHFKNLGLIIIDEEQRFGVEAKERIKELKNDVDCLTLTATPIPRTLQMAITGIKSVSLIETAPKGRYPVQTYVLERNDFIVKDAIERELSKGGQVFYLYNRVEDMDKIVRYVHDLVPEARLSLIHGKMDKDDIEDTLESFINRESDVLVSTTIIETGVDIPNANTLIIHDAERYGLSQLYQIKGRVGRSDKISYAYMMYDKGRRLTEDAQKRLKAIKDFAELGSGFKIAVRDLTTRGAGEILGREQSGFMDKVGVDLYLKLLDTEIKKKKGEIKEEEKTDIRVMMSRHIPKEYISDDYVLIEIHKKISKLESTQELLELKEELTDRFGKVGDSLLEYMYTKLSENLINKAPFERAETTDNTCIFIFSREMSETIDARKLFKIAFETSQSFSFYLKANKIFITYTLKSSKLKMYQDISKYLETIKAENLI